MRNKFPIFYKEAVLKFNISSINPVLSKLFSFGFGAKHAFLRHIQHFENMSMQIRILLNSIQEMKCFFYHANITMNTSA